MSLLRPDVIEKHSPPDEKLYFSQALLFATFYVKNGAIVKYTAECFDFALGPSHSVTFCPWRCATFLIPTFNATFSDENVQSTATWHVMLCYVTLCHVVPRCIMLCHVMPHVVLCCATLCHVVRYLRSR